MISHEHKCIFIHIPKCAGTSIEAALGHHDLYDGWGRQDHRSLAQVQPWSIASALSPASLAAARMNLSARLKRDPNPANRLRVTAEQYDRYFRFSIVRNPWTRCVSWFNNVTRDARHKQTLGLAGKSFRQCLELHVGKGMLRPQTYWLKNRFGVIDLDFVGHFETLDVDFAKVCAAIGKTGIELPELVVSKSRTPASEYFDEASNNLVRTAYAEEIRLFSYEFPG